MIDRIISLLRQEVVADLRPKKLKVLLEEIFRKNNSDIRAFELAELYHDRVFEYLQRIRNEDIENNRDPWFDFNSSSPEYIQGPCFIEPRDSEVIKRAKHNRLKTYAMQKVLEEITFDQFELICTGVLYLLGARNYKKTKRSRDQGIDFFGQLVLGDLDKLESPFIKFHDNFRLWLVGQAKHYPDGKVSTPEIRNLVGAINLARFKEFASTTELMSDLPMKSCDPVFAIFLTTGLFTRDALKLASNSGVILKDKIDLSNFLVDKEIGLNSVGIPTREDLVNWALQFN